MHGDPSTLCPQRRDAIPLGTASGPEAAPRRSHAPNLVRVLQDCGDGSGGDAQCVACPPRKFKDSWGHHGCKPCLSCSLINRVQKSNCTATTNAICGECLPG